MNLDTAGNCVDLPFGPNGSYSTIELLLLLYQPMARVNDLCKLFNAIARQDLQAAEREARQIAKRAELSGNRRTASLLRGSLLPANNFRHDSTDSSTSKMVGRPLTSALTPIKSDVLLGDVHLPRLLKLKFQELLHEWRMRERLKNHSIPLRHKILLHGPPGCGKSMIGAALANELRLPGYVVRLEGIIGSYLGQTALNLHQIFAVAEATPCVILFDEVDAIASKRGRAMDVGELDRIAIALMQNLEHAHISGLVVCASNLFDQIDRAVLRRFDMICEVPMPTRPEILDYATAKSRSIALRLSVKARQQLLKARSYAEAEAMIISWKRMQVLTGDGRR